MKTKKILRIVWYCFLMISIVVIVWAAAFIIESLISCDEEDIETTAVTTDFFTDETTIAETEPPETQRTVKFYIMFGAKLRAATPEVTETEPTSQPTPQIDFTDEEKDLLLRIAMCEAGGGTTEKMAHVMNVVLNRVKSDEFPDTIRDVLYANNQFHPVGTKWFEKIEPSEECQAALGMVMSGWNESMGALYFEDSKKETWHSRNLDLLFSCDGMRFYR